MPSKESQDVRKFTPVSYRTSALLGCCPALTPLLQLITPSRASGTADHVRSLDDLLCMCLCWKGGWVERWVWKGVGCPCPPVRNDIVPPCHLFFLSSFFKGFYAKKEAERKAVKAENVTEIVMKKMGQERRRKKQLFQRTHRPPEDDDARRV